jgi:DNA repair protein RecN (Recombination protein N)
MLSQISIRNLAVIEQLHVEFIQGFQVLTGETGAGKSIVIDALGLIAGARGSSELIRHGCDKAEVEALFELSEGHGVWRALQELGIEPDSSEPLIVRREINSQGKSSARINGQLVNMTMLREIGEYLVNLHGQHEHQSLLKTEKHINLLDQYGKESVEVIRQLYKTAFKDYSSCLTELEQLRLGISQALQLADLYRFQVEEISSAALSLGEDEKLEQERKRLAGGEKLLESVNQAYESVYGNRRGLEAVAEAMDRIQTVLPLDPDQLTPMHEQIQSAYYQLEDAAHQLRSYRDQLDFEPGRLDVVEERLNVIHGLKRKYGLSIEVILAHYQKISDELKQVDHQDERINDAQRRLDKHHEQLAELAAKLTDARREASERLAAEIMEHLRDLNMERTKFTVDFHVSDSFTKDGVDRVEFLISANPGEPPKGLGKIASGGELSRIMLALKSIFAAIDGIPVLVFDEVDTGVSGKAAQAIARKLADLSDDCQVFAVTHLPQVASMADAHYLIHKEVEGERTFTMVDRLQMDARVEELARMLGGAKITDTTLSHAREMIELARTSNP